MADEKDKKVQPINEFIYTWRVQNAHLCWQKNGEKLKSPTFEIDWWHKCPFSLCLYPSGIEGHEHYLSFFLVREDNCPLSNKQQKIELYLLAADGSKVQPENDEGFLSRRKYGILGCPRFISLNTLKKKKYNYFSDGTLTLCFRICSELELDKKEKKQSSEVKAFGRTLLRKEVIAKGMVIDGDVVERQISGEIKSVFQDYLIANFFTYFSKNSGHKNLTIEIDTINNDKIKLAFFELVLIDEKRKKIFWRGNYSWDGTTKPENIVLSSHSSQNVEQYVPHAIFKERLLFLTCQFIFTTGAVVQKREKDDYGTNLNHLITQLPADVPSPTLEDVLMNMYLDNSSHDVSIKMKTSSITAHEIMLHSRTKLRVNDENDSPKVIEVTDKEDTVKRMVYFLYTDNIEDINWEIALSLYNAAVKYEIHLLKCKSANFIKKNLDKSKVVEILKLAKKCNDQELEVMAKSFIMKNETAVFDSDEWSNFAKSDPNLAVEIMLSKYQLK